MLLLLELVLMVHRGLILYLVQQLPREVVLALVMTQALVALMADQVVVALLLQLQ